MNKNVDAANSMGGVEWEKLRGKKQWKTWVAYVSDFATKYAENMRAYDQEKPLPHPQYTGKVFRETVLPSMSRLQKDTLDDLVFSQIEAKIKALQGQTPQNGIDPDIIQRIAKELSEVKI